MLIRGEAPYTYAEVYAGSLNLSENIPSVALTGTLTLTSGSTAVTGAGTSFITELHLGQSVLVVDDGDNRAFLLVVQRIISDTSFITWQAPTFTGTVLGEQGWRLPILFSVDTQRGSLLWGNVLRFDKGTLLSVGSGAFYLNGQLITVSLIADREPQISIFNPNAGTYASSRLGMDTPAPPTLAAVSGGTKGMQAGNYSIVIQPAKTQTDGFNLPSARADVTIATDDKVRINFPAMDTTHLQNAWRVSVTTYAASLGADLNYLEGPWFYYITVDDTQVSSAGGTFDIEWLDAEVERNPIVDFTVPDDPPPDAVFVALLNNILVWISCEGPGYSSVVTSTSPGPFIFPAKPGNIEAAPTNIAFSSSPPEIILGVVSASGRLYILTPNHLQIGQGTPSDVVPVIMQPFLRAGFATPHQVVVANESLYLFTVGGPARVEAQFISQSNADVSPDRGFAAPVQSITDAWNLGNVLVGHDPTNDAICYFHSADVLNEDGFWTTEILVFGLRQNEWLGQIVLSSSTGDQVVSGVATVGGYLEFLCGGRLANNTVEVQTLRFDQVAGATINWAMAAPFSDNGVELRSHCVKRVRVTGDTTTGTLGVFGAQPTEVVDVAALAAGNASSLTGAIALPNTAGVAYGQQFPVNCANLNVSTVQIEGSYAGSGTLDRIDEIAIESAEIGVRR